VSRAIVQPGAALCAVEVECPSHSLRERSRPAPLRLERAFRQVGSDVSANSALSRTRTPSTAAFIQLAPPRWRRMIGRRPRTACPHRRVRVFAADSAPRQFEAAAPARAESGSRKARPCIT